MGSDFRSGNKENNNPKKAQTKKSVPSKPSPAPAKITQPRLIENIYSRKRLFSVLDNALKKPVIWITAQGGAGKTTLITSYIKEKKLPCLWYQIDSGDGDIASFFHYMGIAARYAVPRKKTPLPHLTPEYLGGLPVFTRNYFRELFSRLKTLSVIVFDNYQDAPADSSLHEIIQAGLSEIPEGINVIIISRTEPPSAFAGLRANNRMNIIGWDELELTTEETSGIVQLKIHKKLSAEIIQELHDKTNGWAAGLVLMLEHQGSADMVQRHGKGFTTQAMFDYFAGEIFHKLDTASQEILLQTSFLPIMTRRFAEQLTGLHQAGALLSELNRRNYFTIRKPLPEPVYQYHPLFREFLLTQARQQLTDTQLIQTQRKAAEILEGAGQAEDAIILYSQTGDWASMARIILTQAPTMIAEGRSQTLEEWIKQIPQAVVDETPWLLYWLGICRMHFALSESYQHLENAFELFKKQKDRTGMFIAWSGAVDIFLHSMGNFALLSQWITRLEDMLSNDPTFPTDEIDARVSSSMLFALTMVQPEHPEIMKWAQRADLLLKKTQDVNLRLQICNYLIIYFLWLGEFANAAMIIDSLPESAHLRKAAPLTQLMVKIIEAFYYINTGAFISCLEKVSEGIKLAQQSGIHIQLFCQLLYFGAIASLRMGDFAAADEIFKKIESHLNNSRPIDRLYYYETRAYEALLKKDINRADTYCQMFMQIASEIQFYSVPFFKGLMYYTQAQILHKQGKYAEADASISNVYQIAQKIKSRILEYMSLISNAQFAFDRGNGADGIAFLRQAMAIGREKGYVNFYWWQPDVMSKLCAIALEHNIEVDYVKALIKKRNLLPPADSPMPDSWPFPIKLYTFGRFSLLIDDKLVQFTNRGQKKPMELLKALIALGGRDVPQAEIIDLLWPDTEGDASYRSLITCLQRLRNIIGYKDAVIHTESRMTLDTRYIWSDNWAFERLINHAEVIEKEGSQDKACETRIKALGYYKGSFLEKDTEMAWTLSMREQLRVKFIRQVELIGRYWEGANNWDKALECYQKALSIDNLSEVFYQRLMTAYKMLGRDSDAILAYQRCCKELSSRMGIPPSPATEEIYNSIQKR
ncbi:MAG: BTAD domain-containing putative transcriptional regulator [Nitrospirota bacterium]